MPKKQSDEEELIDNSELEPETEKLDFTKPDFSFIPKGNCQYRQNGNYLVCYSCELKHAVWIGMDKIMVGENEKGPILMNRKKFFENKGRDLK